MVAGLGVALSALWLNQFFPRAETARGLVYPLRLLFGVAMVVTIALGFLAARRHDFADHRAWMIRSYGIGIVAGTQVFTLVAAWAINLTVAEWAIRKRPRRRTPPAPLQVAMP